MSPWNVHTLHLSFREDDSGHPCLDVAPVLEEVKVHSYSLPGVIDRIQFLRTVVAELAYRKSTSTLISRISGFLALGIMSRILYNLVFHLPVCASSPPVLAELY